MTAKFTVFVDDNFHYMDPDERWTLGVFSSAEEAVAASKATVDACLDEAYAPGMSAEELFLRYTHFGDDPRRLRPMIELVVHLRNDWNHGTSSHHDPGMTLSMLRTTADLINVL